MRNKRRLLRLGDEAMLSSASVISLGPIETPILDMQSPAKEGADALRAAIIPLGRISLPDEVAAAALLLPSSESSHISGIDLPVDVGLVSVGGAHLPRKLRQPVS